MTTDRELTRVVRAWLRTDEHESADRVLDDVLALIDSNTQHRAWLAAVPFPRLRRGAWLGLVAAAALVVLVGVPALLPDLRGPGSSASPSVDPGPTSTGSTPAPESSTPAGDRVTRQSDRISFSTSVPGPGWEDFGREYPNYITTSIRGGQGAEAVIFWTVPHAHEFAAPCWYLQTQGIGPTAADLAETVANVPGTELLSGPTPVELGGRPAMNIIFVVREDVGCDPGFFFTYPNLHGGALWPETVPGDTVRVWVVDLGGELFFIEARTRQDVGDRLDEEIQLFVASFEFK